jgi:hypothetical protein
MEYTSRRGRNVWRRCTPHWSARSPSFPDDGVRARARGQCSEALHSAWVGMESIVTRRWGARQGEGATSGGVALRVGQRALHRLPTVECTPRRGRNVGRRCTPHWSAPSPSSPDDGVHATVGRNVWRRCTPDKSARSPSSPDDGVHVKARGQRLEALHSAWVSMESIVSRRYGARQGDGATSGGVALRVGQHGVHRLPTVKCAPGRWCNGTRRCTPLEATDGR